MTMQSGNGSRPSGTDEQQLIELGAKAAEALNNPIFLIEYQILRARYFEQFAKGGNEAKDLMKLQDKIQVLDEIFTDFHGMKSHAERLLAERQQQASPEYQEQQRLDTQGFGLNFGQ